MSLMVEGCLTNEGNIWVVNAARLLQEKLEAILQSNPRIEDDVEELRRRAFLSHISAYTQAGFLELPLSDKIEIALAIEFDEVCCTSKLNSLIMKMFRAFSYHIIRRICALLFVGHVVTSCSFYSMHEGGAFKTENETIALPAAGSNARSFYALDDSTLFFCPILKADDGWTISAFRTENGGNSWSHHADFSMDSFPFVYFDSVGDTVYLGLSSSSVDNPHCVVYSAERRGGAWRKIFSESKRLDGIHVWSGGAALVLSDKKSDPELWVSSDGGRIWDLKDTPFPLSISHYAFRGGDLIAEVSNRLVRYELIPGICDTVYTPPLFSGKSEIIWNYMTTDDYVVLNEGYISKCMAFSGDSLEFRSRIRSREAPGAKIPTALYSRGDTVFVTLQNLAYELRRRTFASVDGGRHWRDLYEGSFASAQGGSLYSIIKNKDGQDCLYKTTVRPY